MRLVVFAWACLAFVIIGRPVVAQLPVELELVLAVDASSSVDGAEFELQTAGYADAFRDPSVVAAVEALGGNGIAVTLVQWSASFQQVQTVGWTRVHDRQSAAAFASAIERQSRKFVTFGTALGTAISYSARLFADSGFAGRRRVIDISADERANTGAHPAHTRADALAAGITVNGLAILSGPKGLERYFQESVIGGPGAFVLTAASYHDLAAAIRQKLLREISLPMTSSGYGRF